MASDLGLFHRDGTMNPAQAPGAQPIAGGPLSDPLHWIIAAVQHLLSARDGKRMQAQLKADIKRMQRAAPHVAAEMLGSGR